jgi:hypothetical protein
VALAAQKRGLEVLVIPGGDDPTGPLQGESSPGWPSINA